MGKGNLNYLHTFDEISKIYKIDSSTLRKQVAQGKYVIGKDVKKFGKTWIMTEECMTRTFGEGMYNLYLANELNKKIAETKKSKVSASKNKKIITSLDSDDDENLDVNSWSEKEPKGITLNSFSFK